MGGCERTQIYTAGPILALLKWQLGYSTIMLPLWTKMMLWMGYLPSNNDTIPFFWSRGRSVGPIFYHIGINT
jgi:hypothetical protein